MTTDVAPAQIKPLTRDQIENRLKYCPRLPSLGSINSALRELLNADQRYTSQVAEIIRRDPSLTARLLRLVNSVYYGLATPVNSIEDAVFYLGVRQIRQLVMVTPIIDGFPEARRQGQLRLARVLATLHRHGDPHSRSHQHPARPHRRGGLRGRADS